MQRPGLFDRPMSSAMHPACEEKCTGEFSAVIRSQVLTVCGGARLQCDEFHVMSLLFNLFHYTESE